MPARPRLTDRQTAVLAALERRGRASLLDLREDFPDLAPSAVKRHVRALRRRGLVDAAGDEEEVYLGGVVFWPVRERRGDEDELRDVAHRLARAGWDPELGVADGTVAVTVPPAAVADFLMSVEDGRLGALREVLTALVQEAAIHWIGPRPSPAGLEIVLGVTDASLDEGSV